MNITRVLPLRLSQDSRAILFMLLNVFLLTLLDASAKSLVDSYPMAMIVWVRFFGQLVLVALLLRGRFLPKLRTRHPRMHLARALTQMGAAAFFFASLGYIGLAEATALADINPVLITVGAALFLGEALGPRRVFGVLVALAGALIIIRPGSGIFTPAALLPLCSAVCYAATTLITRWASPREDIWTPMALTPLICTVVIGLTLPFIWVPVQLADLPAFVLIGLFGTLAQLCAIRALTLAGAATVAPFTYVGIIFATLWGVLFYGNYPDGWTIFGALAIVIAGVYVWHRETQTKAASEA